MTKYKVIFNPGDIILYHNDRSVVGNLIAFGQMFGRGPSNIVHASIAVSPRHVIGMDGKFITEDEVARRDVFDIFRCSVPAISNEAAKQARYLMENDFNIKYSDFGKKGGIWSVLSRKSAARGNIADKVEQKVGRRNCTENSTHKMSLFCSSFVVLCYKLAIEKQSKRGLFIDYDARNAFSLEHHCYNPSYLSRRLEKSKSFQRIRH